VLHRRPHVFHDHVGALHQAHERRAALGRLEIEPHHALVAVQVLEIGPVALAREVFSRWFRRLDADDVRAPVGEMPHAGRARARQREVQHREAGQGKVGRAGVVCGRGLG
jgi:hypothetical protein